MKIKLFNTNETPYQRNIQSMTIDYLRFPMAIMVIFIHQYPILLDNDNALNVIHNVIISSCTSVIPRIAVPVFFFISGYLLFLKISDFTKEEYILQLKKRYKSLLLPYFYWNIIAFLVPIALLLKDIRRHLISESAIYDYLKGFNIGIFWDSQRWTMSWRCFGLLSPGEGTGPIDFPLWFIRNLIILVCLSPLIYYFVKKFGGYFIAILGFCFVSVIWIDYFPLDITGVFFFSAGCYWSIKKKEIIDLFRGKEKYIYTITAVLCILCVFLKVTSQVRLFSTFINFYVLGGVISIYCILYRLIETGRCPYQPRVLAKSSFFIYAMHVIYINGALKYQIYRIADGMFGFCPVLGDIVSYLITPLTVGAICLGLYVLMSKITPNLLHALTGNR